MKNIKRSFTAFLTLFALVTAMSNIAVASSSIKEKESIDEKTQALITETIVSFFENIYCLDNYKDTDLSYLFLDKDSKYIEYYNDKSILYFGVPQVYGDEYAYVDVKIELDSCKITEEEKDMYSADVFVHIYAVEAIDIERTSQEILPYSFKLTNVDNEFKLVEVTSDDHLDSTLRVRSASEQLAYLKDKLNNPVPNPTIDACEKMYMQAEEKAAILRSTITYDRDDAVEYAETYWQNYNSSFGSYGGDCQNFASQCVWKGYGGTNIPTAYPPSVVYNPMVLNYNGTSARNWYQGSVSGNGWVSWTNPYSFFNYINNSSTSVRGPMGWIYDRESDCLKYAMPGDVILVYWDYLVQSPDEPDHAYIVIDTDNAYGYNNVSTIIAAAHTNNCTNYRLSNLLYSEDKFALIRIASWQSGN
jgi:hypothetical protein